MPTTFIALQCYQCSTMQVKQQKKSGNKWRCTVCNQNQSVRRLFARGCMAKDLRKFVQSFNMSRSFSDEKHGELDDRLVSREEEGPIDLVPGARCGDDRGFRKKARTDWSEYLDSVEEVEDEEQGGQGDDLGLEPTIVTELPFKKTQSRMYASRSGSGQHGGGGGCDGKLYKPVFSKGAANKVDMTEDREQRRYQPTEGAVTSKSRNDNCWTATGGQKVLEACQTTTIKASKWNDYLTQDDDCDNLSMASGRNPNAENVDKRGCDTWVTTLDDQKVEDDIHPDFI